MVTKALTSGVTTPKIVDYNYIALRLETPQISNVAEPQVQEQSGSIRFCPSCHAVYRAQFARCPVDGEALEVGDTEPLIGTMFGQHYLIDACIGEGAMARVYRAHHSLLPNKQFAVKVLIGDLSATVEMRMRFAAEADASSKLDHPNVVSVVDYGRSETGLMYIVMELVSGKSLFELIDETGPIPQRRTLDLARQICQGLAHAHERGLVHRDLKPENIVLSGRPELARIVDFGLAIPTDDERSTRLTGEGLTMGTPIYASPEQTHSEPVDHRADLFALGVTMYEMLSGKPPFEGNLLELINQNASDVMPAIVGDGGEHIAPATEAIVRKLMRRDPAHRYQSAAEVLEALEAVALAPSEPVVLLSAASLAVAASTPAFVTGKSTIPMPQDVVQSDASPEPRRPFVRAVVGLMLAAGIALGANLAVTGSTEAAAEEPAIIVPSPTPEVVAPAIAPDVVTLPPPGEHAKPTPALAPPAAIAVPSPDAQTTPAPPTAPARQPRLGAAKATKLNPAAKPVSVEPSTAEKKPVAETIETEQPAKVPPEPVEPAPAPVIAPTVEPSTTTAPTELPTTPAPMAEHSGTTAPMTAAPF